MLSHTTVESIVQYLKGCIEVCGVSERRQQITLELYRGTVSLLSIPQQTNVFNTSKYTWLDFFPKVLLICFQRVQNIFYLAISLIMLIRPTELTPFYRWIIIFPLGFNIMIFIFKEFMLNRNRWIQDDLINNQQTKRGVYSDKREDATELVQWRDLQIGDVVYLTKGEIVPADIILLDSGHVREREALCMIDTQYTDGKSTLTSKKSCYLTQLIVTRTRLKHNWKEYRKILTGKLEYDLPNGKTKEFRGKLKLKKDPKIENLTIDHFIPKGSKIRQTSWIFGLVVYTGMDTRMMNCSNYANHKIDYYTRMSNKLTSYFLAMIAFFALISILVLLSRSDDLTFMKQFDPNATSGIKIFNLLVLYAQLLPFNLFLLQDLIQLICKYIIEHEITEKYKGQFIKVNDSTTLSDLGQADYMLLDKTGTLTTSYQKIDSVLFGSNKFWINHDNMIEHLNNPSKGSGQTEPEYHINFENEAGDNIRPLRSDQTIINSIRDSKFVNQMRITKPKKNDSLFGQSVRKPVPPCYVSYNQILSQPPNLSLSDLKLAIDHELENNHSHLNSQNNNQESHKLKPSMRRSVIQRRNILVGQDLVDQSGDLVRLIKSYEKEGPQLRYERVRDENDLIFDSFLKCLMLCHEARPIFLGTNEIIYESFSKNEEVALQFARMCGYHLVKFNRSDSPDEYFCKINKQSLKYKILGLNEFTYFRKLNSVVVQCPPGNEIDFPDYKDYAGLQHLSGKGSGNASILICKGDYEAMKDLLDINQREREEMESMLQIYKRRGVRMIIYATRELSEGLTEEYQRNFNLYKSSLTSQENQLEKLAIDFEVNLNILGIMGFQEELKPDAFDFVSTMRASNISCWMLSGDQEPSTLSCAFALGMTDPMNSKILHISKHHHEKIFIQLNNCLGVVQQELTKNPTNISKQIVPLQKPRPIKSSTTVFADDNFNKMNLFTLAFNGQSLSVIVQDQELSSHFKFLCCICKNVIGYNLDPQQKQFMCRMIKENFPNQPTVIAVGDGFNDALMMQEADVSIEVLNRGKKGRVYKPQVNAGDILVSSLDQIKTLVLTHGKQTSERTSNVIFFLFYGSLFMGMTLFYFNWFCVFTASSMHDSMTIFMTNFLFMLPNSIVIGLLDEPTNNHVNNHFPALYVDGQIRRKYFLLFFLLQSFLEGILQGSAVFYATVFLTQYSTNAKGQASDLQMMSTIIIYTILIATNFKMFFILLNRGVKSVIVSQAHVVISIIIFIVINFQSQFSYWNYRALTYQIFIRFDTMMCLCFNLIVCFFISLFCSVVRLHLMPYAYEQFASANTDGKSWDAILNSEIIQQTISRTLDVSEIVKTAFAGAINISPYIQEILNPGDTQVTEMRIEKISCRMKELVLEKKFRTAKLRNSIYYYRFFFILLFIYFGAYALADYLASSQKQFTGFQYLILFMIIMLFLGLTFLQPFIQNYYLISHIVVGMIVVLKIAIDWLSSDFGIALSAQLLLIMATINTTNMTVIPIFFYNIAYFLQFVARVITIGASTRGGKVEGIYSTDRVTTYTVSTVIIVSLCILVLLLNLYYRGIKMRRNDFLARDQIEQDNNVAQDILSILVPKFVQQSISSGVYSMQEAQDDVSILFLYICDFDNIMKEEGKNVVPMLDSLFRVYDNLCLQHGVQKIETVGYTYMAASGIQACEVGVSSHILRTEKTTRLVNLAFDMQKQVVGRRYGKGNQVEIKVGIHVGRVIAGVIGHHKPQFSLIGDPVNQTSRVCSTGDVGAITLSETAFLKARKDIKYHVRKQKEAKGLGIINTYQVFHEKPQNFQQSIAQLKFQGALEKVRVAIREKTIFRNRSDSQGLINRIMKEQKKVEAKPDESVVFGQVAKVQLSASQQAQYHPKKTADQEVPNQTNEEYELFAQDLETTGEEQKDTLQADRIFLTIQPSQALLMENFLNITKEKNQTAGRYTLAGLSFTYLILTLLLIIVRKLLTYSTAIFAMRAVFLGCNLVLFPMFHQAYTQQTIRICYWLLLVYGAITTLFQAYCTSNQNLTTISILELLFIILVSCNLNIFSFLGTLLYLVTTFFCFLGIYISSNLVSMYYVFYVFAAVCLIAITSHQTQRENIEIFNNLQLNEEKKVKQLSLVSQLLPTHAFLKLRNSSIYNKQDLTDEFHEVTLLFADIKGFTEYSNSTTPEGVVLMLRNLFTEFDKKCQYFNVYKVYTIGDCYVVMGFTNSAKRNPIQEAINTINMGFAMIDIIRDVRRKINFDRLDMRIGIHTGYVIGGIIGTDIVRYDIYGKDVSIANKMESNGEEGRIMVSETTKSMVDRSTEKSPFTFEKIKDVDLPKFGVCYAGYLVDKNPQFISGDNSPDRKRTKIKSN